MNPIQDLLASLANPAARHAMYVHAPIVLGVLGVIPLAIASWNRFGNRTLLWVALACLLGASIGAGCAASAGEEAVERLGPITPEQASAVDLHRELGEGGWIWPLIPAIAIGIALAAKNRAGLRVFAGCLGIASSLGVATWVTLTAHEGGKLVYVHGLGTPRPEDATASTTAADPMDLLGPDLVNED